MSDQTSVMVCLAHVQDGLWRPDTPCLVCERNRLAGEVERLKGALSACDRLRDEIILTALISTQSDKDIDKVQRDHVHELQLEVIRLNEENERLEAELEQIKFPRSPMTVQQAARLAGISNCRDGAPCQACGHCYDKLREHVVKCDAACEREFARAEAAEAALAALRAVIQQELDACHDPVDSLRAIALAAGLWPKGEQVPAQPVYHSGTLTSTNGITFTPDDKLSTADAVARVLADVPDMLRAEFDTVKKAIAIVEARRAWIAPFDDDPATREKE